MSPKKIGTIDNLYPIFRVIEALSPFWSSFPERLGNWVSQSQIPNSFQQFSGRKRIYNLQTVRVKVGDM